MFRNFLRRKPAQSEKNEDRIVADVYGSMNQEYVKNYSMAVKTLPAKY